MTARARQTDRRVVDSVESRAAAQFAAALNLTALDLPHDVTERLRAGREQALAAARLAVSRQAVAAPAAAPVRGAVRVGVTASGAATMGGFAPWWHRAAALVPVAALVVGLVLINHQAEMEQVSAAAEIDAQLLADDLPPAAYSDPGFAEYLRSGGDAGE